MGMTVTLKMSIQMRGYAHTHAPKWMRGGMGGWVVVSRCQRAWCGRVYTRRLHYGVTLTGCHLHENMPLDCRPIAELAIVVLTRGP